MTSASDAQNRTLHLQAGLDRSLAWEEGDSVRYVVAELSASGAIMAPVDTPALNLSLAIDISSSMRGEKIEAAKKAALAVVEALGARDRLSIIAFDGTAELCLDTLPMDEAGHAAAARAIHILHSRGQTNLFDGWLMAAERVARAMAQSPQASHRVLLLSDGQTNQGKTDRTEIAQHVGALLERGVVTSALGIGNGYDEELLGAIAEAGGGNLHDAAEASEIGAIALGELQAGRAALVERICLRLSVPANVRAEVVGPWSHVAVPGAIEVMAGSIMPERTRKIVFRLYCSSGVTGSSILLGLTAAGTSPEGDALIEAVPVEVDLRLARSNENNAQRRDMARSLAVVEAWQADAIRRAVRMNRDGERSAARFYIARELSWMEYYASNVPGTETLIDELMLVQRHANENWGERTRKEMSNTVRKRSRGEAEMSLRMRPTISDQFR